MASSLSVSDHELVLLLLWTKLSGSAIEPMD